MLSLIKNDTLLAEMGRRSEAFLRKDAKAEIVRHIHASLQGISLPQEGPVQPRYEQWLPSNRALAAKLERACEELGTNYAPEAMILRQDDLAYFKNRAASLLVHHDWEERNLGVKLLGFLKAKEKIPLLLALLYDRRPTSLLKRAFGGDFKQVGFIRRNIMTALRRLDEVTPKVEAALLFAFQDPYYEVRAEAVRTAAYFGCRITMREEIVSALLRLTSDRNIEVAAAAAEGVGKLGDESVVLPALLAMRHYKFWKVRAAALKGIHALVERGQVTDYERLLKELPDFVLTATDFMPQFETKSEYRRLMETMSVGKGSQK